MKKFAPNTNNIYEHIMPLLVEDFRVIVSLFHNNIDLSQDTIPSEMVKMCINILNSQHVTPEEQTLFYFTLKKLKTLYT